MVMFITAYPSALLVGLFHCLIPATLTEMLAVRKTSIEITANAESGIPAVKAGVIHVHVPSADVTARLHEPSSS